MNLASFAHHASRACPGHAELALALAAEFHAPVPGVDAVLEDLARGLPVRRHARADDQLAACADLLAGRLQATALSWSAIDDLLLDRGLAAGAGPPLALAVAWVERARRAGIDLGIVAGGAGCFRRPSTVRRAAPARRRERAGRRGRRPAARRRLA